ncbi:MAG: hypothetical protein U9N84_08100, partial [Actinomycetota bacterium]|nr:hypothetical protein [Actinomycetota bacterium]
GLVVLLGVGSLAGCSSSDPQAVEFIQGVGHDGPVPFTASGEAVDEAGMCDSGRMEMVRLESVDGEPLTDADWADMFDTAMAASGVAEMNVFENWDCDDGSGAFTMVFHNVFDFSTFDFEGQQDVGTWSIHSGTGSYEATTGSGSAVRDFDTERAVLTGQIEG